MADSGGSRADGEGIHIGEEVAAAVGIDEELDSNIVGPYRFPNPRRRRIGGWVYLAGAALAFTAMPRGWILGAGLIGVAAWHFASAWPLLVSEEEAMALASANTGYVVGHASAAVTFHGWRARPRWSVITYSADEPPSQRALVIVDAVTGLSVGDPYIEALTPVTGGP